MKPVRLTVRTSRRVRRDLDLLASTGIFGETRGAVAEQLLRERLAELVEAGWTEARLRRLAAGALEANRKRRLEERAAKRQRAARRLR